MTKLHPILFLIIWTICLSLTMLAVLSIFPTHENVELEYLGQVTQYEKSAILGLTGHHSVCLLRYNNNTDIIIEGRDCTYLNVGDYIYMKNKSGEAEYILK